jgi:hypothetical protein
MLQRRVLTLGSNTSSNMLGAHPGFRLLKKVQLIGGFTVASAIGDVDNHGRYALGVFGFPISARIAHRVKGPYSCWQA